MVAKADALRAETDAWELDIEVLPTSMFTHVVGPNGKVPMGPPAIVPECGVASISRKSAFISSPRMMRPERIDP